MGTGVAAGSRSGGVTSALPWAIALIAVLALVALLAGQRFNRQTASSLDAPLNALPQAGLDDRAGAAGTAAPAPDISRMTPRERADRLFNIIMELDQRGRTDSVRFFAQMAIPAHLMLPDLDADARYHIGRIEQAARIPPFGASQADTILQSNPSHLLGLILALQAARSAGNERVAREFTSQLLEIEGEERRNNLPEYLGHKADIDRALSVAGNKPSE